MLPIEKPMTNKEIKELMRRRGWSQAELARQLELSESAVCKWLRGSIEPLGPARILMRLWLEESRKQERHLQTA